MFRTISHYEEDGLGLLYPVVLIDSVEEELDAAGTQIGVSIPDMEQLVAAVAIARAIIPLRLDGQEVRFMRHALDMTATALAEALEIDKATFSRWENNKQSLGGWADKQIRLMVVVTLGKFVPSLNVDAEQIPRMRIADRPDGVWPQLEMRRVAAPGGGADGAEQWDRLRLAA